MTDNLALQQLQKRVDRPIGEARSSGESVDVIMATLLGFSHMLEIGRGEENSTLIRSVLDQLKLPRP